MIRLGRTKRKRFTVLQGRANLSRELPRLPGLEESFAFVTEGGFASVSFILRVAEQSPITDLYASTFRVGKKEIRALAALRERGRLERAAFLLSGVSQDDKRRDAGQFDLLVETCARYGWRWKSEHQHSKVFLMHTEDGAYYVLETSSNLNENPRIEQFRFENDEALYTFYRDNLFERYLH